MSSPKAPKPTAAQLQQESDQAAASAMLDKQENERRKRLLNAASGVRAFAGSAIGRAAPSNTAATGAPSAAQQSAFVAPAVNSGNFGAMVGPGATFLPT